VYIKTFIFVKADYRPKQSNLEVPVRGEEGRFIKQVVSTRRKSLDKL
jgi:hypothetical protein